MALLFVTHEIRVETATNLPPDQIEYAAPFTFHGFAEPLSGSKKMYELGVEGEGLYIAYLNPQSTANLARLKLSSRVSVRLLGSADPYRTLYINSRYLVHDTLPDLAHVEFSMKEDVFLNG